MITVLTSHNKIWNTAQVVTDIINEYQTTGKAIISLNNEGPCAESIGLYAILDYICSTFNFLPSNIWIHTTNFEELHQHYQIKKLPQHWIQATTHAFNKENYVANKTDNFKLFGCLYNVPSWERLCLSSYITQKIQHKSVVHVNGVWEGHKYNSYYLDAVTDFCPDEFFNIANFLKTVPVSALPDLNDIKPVSAKQMLEVLPLYNNFLIDIVSETYTQGLTFFITEKTLRPILAQTPFIIFGPQGYLHTLKSDYGFKSFDNWWDESYDNYQNYERIQKIYKVIDYIDSKSDSELASMYTDMTDTLIHNYDRLQELNDKK
jgi:hypothetical protein